MLPEDFLSYPTYKKTDVFVFVYRHDTYSNLLDGSFAIEKALVSHHLVNRQLFFVMGRGEPAGRYTTAENYQTCHL